MQNGFIESFNGKLRDEKLNDTLFSTLHQARVELSKWRNGYNHHRPHSSLKGQTPGEFANRARGMNTPALRASAFMPIAKKTNKPLSTVRANSKLDRSFRQGHWSRSHV